MQKDHDNRSTDYQILSVLIFLRTVLSNFSIPKYNLILASMLLVYVKLIYSSEQHIIYMYFKLKFMQKILCKNAKQNLSDLYFTWFGDSQI